MPNDDVHAGHRRRLRARFRAEGLDSFELHNALELLLFYAIPRIDTNELAHTLMNRFGGISEVFDAPCAELLRVKGMTENAATLIKLMPELFRVYAQNRRLPERSLDSPAALGEYLSAQFIGRTKECVFLLSLDSSLKPIGCDLLAEGSATSSHLEAKQVVECLLRHNAARAVLAHNHPRGEALPSNEDVVVTRQLKHSLTPIGFELVDHIIVAGENFYSVSEHFPNL